MPPDVIVKLLEVDHPFCGFKVGSYCLSGTPVPGRPFPVEIYQNTAGAWFLHRSLFRHFRWLWDPDDGLTDDPATYRLIRDHLHCEQHNRCDVSGDHGVLVPFEARGTDTGVRRHPLAGHPITAVIPVYFPGPEHVEMTTAILDKVFDEMVARVYVIDNGGAAEHVAEAARELAARAAEQGARLQRDPGAGLQHPPDVEPGLEGGAGRFRRRGADRLPQQRHRFSPRHARSAGPRRAAQRNLGDLSRLRLPRRRRRAPERRARAVRAAPSATAA